jgi:S1-C subfamily serine protease
LGITVLEVDNVTAERNNMMRPGGVMIESVLPDTPAETAGLRQGDVIIRIDGRKIADINSFMKLIESNRGIDIGLVILRSGARKSLKMTTAGAGGVLAAAVAPIKQPTEFTWLGAEITPAPGSVDGAYVAETGGLMAAAGVRQGDLIKKINNTRVADLHAFIELSKKADVKKGFLLDVIRAGDPLYITVKG